MGDLRRLTEDERVLQKANASRLAVQLIEFPERGTKWWIDLGCAFGKGASSGVHAGESDATLEAVAIKRLLGSQAEATERRDLENAKRLLDRRLEHVIPVFGCGSVDGIGYIVMARASGTLESEIRARTRGRTYRAFSAEETGRILEQLARGVMELHKARIRCHRDLKPGNALYHEGRWKVADFGLAKAATLDVSTRTVRLLATPEYAAPELWDPSADPDEKSDVYSLGCIGYALLAGRPPFGGDEKGLRKKKVSKVVEFRGIKGGKLHGLLGRMLAKSRSQRPSCSEVIFAVGRDTRA